MSDVLVFKRGRGRPKRVVSTATGDDIDVTSTTANATTATPAPDSAISVLVKKRPLNKFLLLCSGPDGEVCVVKVRNNAEYKVGERVDCYFDSGYFYPIRIKRTRGLRKI